MITGTYAITMQTGMGLKKGTVVLVEADGKVDGRLKAMGSNSTLSGTTDGNRFEVSGVMRTPLIRIPYSAQGEVNGDTLTAVIRTRYGPYPVQGSRTN